MDVLGAASQADADKVAFAIANSPLVKTAIFGHDANWGRVAAAAGKCGVPFSQENVDIDFMGVPVLRAGLPVPMDEDDMLRRFEQSEIDIAISLGAGDAHSRVWTCDLTHDYVKINGEYRTWGLVPGRVWRGPTTRQPQGRRHACKVAEEGELELAQRKAEVLTEALPWINKMRGKTVVVKYGGSAMEDPKLMVQVLGDIELHKLMGMRVVLVHGGGKAISAVFTRLNMPVQFKNGLRVTDDDTWRPCRGPYRQGQPAAGLGLERVRPQRGGYLGRGRKDAQGGARLA